AEEKQRDEQQRHRMQAEPDHCNERNADFAELEPPRHHRFVVAVGELATERGKEEVRRDEDRRGERDERLGIRPADVEQDEKDERVLEEVIAEGRKKLGPEQGREAPRHQQRRGHDFSAGSNGRAARNARRNTGSVYSLPPASQAPRGEGWGEGL